MIDKFYKNGVIFSLTQSSCVDSQVTSGIYVVVINTSYVSATVNEGDPYKYVQNTHLANIYISTQPWSTSDILYEDKNICPNQLIFAKFCLNILVDKEISRFFSAQDRI